MCFSFQVLPTIPRVGQLIPTLDEIAQRAEQLNARASRNYHIKLGLLRPRREDRLSLLLLY